VEKRKSWKKKLGRRCRGLDELGSNIGEMPVRKGLAKVLGATIYGMALNYQPSRTTFSCLLTPSLGVALLGI
jgi:hypothetical protein